jgi:hypothetical protein
VTTIGPRCVLTHLAVVVACVAVFDGLAFAQGCNVDCVKACTRQIHGVPKTDYACVRACTREQASACGALKGPPVKPAPAPPTKEPGQGPPPIAGPKSPSPTPVLEVRRAPLVRGQVEQPNYGLYSYVVIRTPPTDATRQGYLATLKAFSELIEPAYDTDPTPPDLINITYLPVISPVPGTPEHLLDVYDFQRARELVRAIPSANRDGPYIVSCRCHLTTQLNEPFLYQDLTGIEPFLMEAWVREFLRQSAQQRFWEPNGMSHLALRVRTGVARVANVAPEVMNALMLSRMVWR